MNLTELLRVTANDRAKWLRETFDQSSRGTLEGVKAATSVEQLESALHKRIAREATRASVPAGTMVLQPSAAPASRARTTRRGR